MDERRQRARPVDLQRPVLNQGQLILTRRVGYSSGTQQGGGARQAPPRTGGRSAAGSASPCQGEGRGFESRRPLWVALHVESTPGASLHQWVFQGNDVRPSLSWEPSCCVRRCGGERHGGVAEWLRQGPAKPCTRVRFPPPPRAISSVGERYLDTVEVTGSIPVSPTIAAGCGPSGATKTTKLLFDRDPFGTMIEIRARIP